MAKEKIRQPTQPKHPEAAAVLPVWNTAVTSQLWWGAQGTRGDELERYPACTPVWESAPSWLGWSVSVKLIERQRGHQKTPNLLFFLVFERQLLKSRWRSCYVLCCMRLNLRLRRCPVSVSREQKCMLQIPTERTKTVDL